LLQQLLSVRIYELKGKKIAACFAKAMTSKRTLDSRMESSCVRTSVVRMALRPTAPRVLANGSVQRKTDALICPPIGTMPSQQFEQVI